MKILVTGASGFIGGHFVSRYREEEGVELHGLGRRSHAQVVAEHMLRGLPAPEADYYHVHDLSLPLTLDMRPDVVIHAAGLASPWGRVEEFERHNVEATRHVVEWCERNGLPRLLYLSSSSVLYRRYDQFGLTEKSPVGPTFVNTYARTKYAGECLARRYAGTAVVLRPRAVFGPGDSVLFPRLLEAARRGRLPIIVRGGAPVVGDLIYIDTLVDYLMRVAQSPVPADTYNLTNAEPVVLMEFLMDIFQRLHLPVSAWRLDYRIAWLIAALAEGAWGVFPLRGEPPVTRFGIEVLAYSKTFDVSRTLADLGPPSMGLNEGVADFVAWQKARL